QSKYKENSSPKCWRECGEWMANHSHIFWSCKAIKGSWENSIKEMLNIFGISLGKNPPVILLEKIPEEINKNYSHLFLIIRVAMIKQMMNSCLVLTRRVALSLNFPFVSRLNRCDTTC
uniref:Reverse transcriptase zinc-binding domain-containing protein n=1 Tax=Seriola lalandi dorsalis TaxID=1841481 RepID=A0A3B4WPV2_SERLL